MTMTATTTLKDKNLPTMFPCCHTATKICRDVMTTAAANNVLMVSTKKTKSTRMNASVKDSIKLKGNEIKAAKYRA
jgi:hypothetical protein